MPNPTVRAAALGLPKLTPDQAIANLESGLDAHFADPIVAAIKRHRRACDACKASPEGKTARLALAAALEALVATPCATRFGALDLLTHLLWWIAEEAEFSDSHQPAYGIAQARVADLGLFLGQGIRRGPCPVASLRSLPSVSMGAR